MENSFYNLLVAAARNGHRIRAVYPGADKPRTLWSGLGNRAGLHSYAEILLAEKWLRSGARFERKLNTLPAGTKVTIYAFVNISRDRGGWVAGPTFTV